MSASVIDYQPSLGGRLRIDVTGGTSTANAGLGSVANPFGRTVLIRRAELITKTPSTGAANLSIGVTTASAAATDVLNAAAVNGLSANHVYNAFEAQNTAKTAITAPALWTTSKYLTFTGSADTSGYSGVLLLEVIFLD